MQEEEDEYDKVAVGSEGTDDRLFMGQIRDFGTSLNLITPLPTSFEEVRQVRRDARANHEAALARLEEDDRQAANIVANETSKALVDTFGTGSERKECAAGNGDANVGEQSSPSKNEEDAMEIDGDGKFSVTWNFHQFVSQVYHTRPYLEYMCFPSVNFITLSYSGYMLLDTIFLNILYVLVKVEALGSSHFFKTHIKTKGILFSRSGI